MTCREFADFMVDYLSDELPSDTRALFERHLTRCDDCAGYLKLYAMTVKLGKRAFEHEDGALPADVPERLVAAILAARRASASRSPITSPVH